MPCCDRSSPTAARQPLREHGVVDETFYLLSRESAKLQKYMILVMLFSGLC